VCQTIEDPLVSGVGGNPEVPEMEMFDDESSTLKTAPLNPPKTWVNISLRLSDVLKLRGVNLYFLHRNLPCCGAGSVGVDLLTPQPVARSRHSP
jgi:hypothetical protein